MSLKLFCAVNPQFPPGLVIVPKKVYKAIEAVEIAPEDGDPEVIQGNQHVGCCWGRRCDLRRVAELLEGEIRWEREVDDDFSASFFKTEELAGVMEAVGQYLSLLVNRISKWYERRNQDRPSTIRSSKNRWPEHLFECVTRVREEYQDLYKTSRLNHEALEDTDEPRTWVLDVWVVKEPGQDDKLFFNSAEAAGWAEEAGEAVVEAMDGELKTTPKE